MVDCIYFLVLDIIILSFLFNNFRLNKWIYVTMSLILLLNNIDYYFVHYFKHIPIDIFIPFHVTFILVFLIHYDYIHSPFNRIFVSNKVKKRINKIVYIFALSFYFIMSFLVICLYAFDFKNPLC